MLAVAAISAGGAAAPAAAAVKAHLTSAWVVPSGGRTGTAPAASAARHQGDPLGQVVLPDAFAVAPKTVTSGQLARLARLRYVRKVITVDAGQVRIKGRLVDIIGVSQAQFRPWAPAQTAARPGVWTELSRGAFVTTPSAAKQLGLREGDSYQVVAATKPGIRFGTAAAIGIPGVDAIVGAPVSRLLGLVPRLGVLISAPGAGLPGLQARVRAVLGKTTRFVSLVPAQRAARTSSSASSAGPLPVDSHVSPGRPDTYLALFEDSAAEYCPGLSWTVLAAIGQIESGDGRNVGPSSAGALGPMQFLPSTWSRWGLDAFGETGSPNIMDPYDAVPAAANYLCAFGAAGGGAALASAIYAYNHASWYVNEVLALAHEYAREYG